MSSESLFGQINPIGLAKNYVTIKPRDETLFFRDGPQSDIKQTLLLPKYRAAVDLDENVRVFFGEFKHSVKRQLDRDKWRPQISAKPFIIREATPVASRIEVRRHGPHVRDTRI